MAYSVNIVQEYNVQNALIFTKQRGNPNIDRSSTLTRTVSGLLAASIWNVHVLNDRSGKVRFSSGNSTSTSSHLLQAKKTSS